MRPFSLLGRPAIVPIRRARGNARAGHAYRAHGRSGRLVVSTTWGRHGSGFWRHACCVGGHEPALFSAGRLCWRRVFGADASAVGSHGDVKYVALVFVAVGVLLFSLAGGDPAPRERWLEQLAPIASLRWVEGAKFGQGVELQLAGAAEIYRRDRLENEAIGLERLRAELVVGAEVRLWAMPRSAAHGHPETVPMPILELHRGATVLLPPPGEGAGWVAGLVRTFGVLLAALGVGSWFVLRRLRQPA